MNRIITILIALVFITNATAQSEIRGNYKRVSLDVYGGLPIYFGDIDNEYKGYDVTARLNWNLTSAFSVGATYTYGKLEGLNDDAMEAYFTNKYMRIMGGSEIYFFNALNFNEITKWFQPYVGLSFGAFKSNIEDSGNILIENTNHYNEWAFAHAYHAGMKFKLAKWLDLNARYGATFTNTDLLDNYIEDNFNDIVSNVELGLTFHIGGKNKEPIIWRPAQGMNENLTKEEDLAELEEELATAKAGLDSAKAVIGAQTAANITIASELAEVKSEVETIKNRKGNSSGIFGADEHIYEATLRGPIDATYYIVVGSYAEPENAVYRKNEVNANGYSAFIMDEVSADLKRVMVDYTDDYDEVIRKVAKYRQEVDPSAWIIKKRDL